ncbi:MAG: hypothetical protein KAJ51_10815 [Thermoplasmata archaeon]|nr:hypothetical protein [Thermoplasmata archaeon]
MRRKLIISVIIAIILLLIASITPTTMVVAKPKVMDPPDGYIHYINTTTTPPILDGTVFVGTTWQTNDYVGNMFIRNNPTPVAKVYAKVEVDSGGDYQFLWIGVEVLSPFTVTPTVGQWIRIDWDRNGIMDYEDHTGWTDTDGVDTAKGAEWMVPWGKCRRNEGQGSTTMDPALVGHCLDILVHIEVNLPGGGSDSGLFPGERPHGHFDSTTLCIWQQQGPPEPGPGGWGLRTIGFWKHQLRTALGAPGHRHVPTANLTGYLGNISTHTTVPELKGLSLRDALMVLELRGKHSMYDKAVQQLLATWLNLQGDGDQMVDTDGDGLVDTLLSTAITYAESIITDSGSTHDQLEGVKDMLDIINNSGSS